MVLGTILLFYSCRKDDNTKTDDGQSIMVGKWKYSWGNGYSILTFKSDGTGTYFEYNGGSIDANNDSLHWSYEETGSILTIKWLEGYHLQIADKTIVQLTWINEKSFAADLIDSGSVWIKQ